MALLKNVPLTESKSLQFRFEGFNVFNHAQFFGPASVNGNINSSSFGAGRQRGPSPADAGRRQVHLLDPLLVLGVAQSGCQDRTQKSASCDFRHPPRIKWQWYDNSWPRLGEALITILIAGPGHDSSLFPKHGASADSATLQRGET